MTKLIRKLKYHFRKLKCQFGLHKITKVKIEHMDDAVNYFGLKNYTKSKDTSYYINQCKYCGRSIKESKP
jgi:hypothetical protein